MTQTTRKPRTNISPNQKLEYVKLITEEGYSHQQVMELSGAGASAITRWKRQYLEELQGKMPSNKTALTPENRRIQELEKQLAQAKSDNELLKKATAFFIRDNPALK